MARSNRTPTREFTDEGVRDRDHEESPELATDGRSNSASFPGRGSGQLMDTQAPGDFLGGNTDISTLTSLVSQICAQSTPQSKPTWDWGPQKICCRAGPWQASLPGSEKGGEGPQSSSTAVHMLVHTCKQKNEGMALTRHGDHSHLLVAQLLLSFHFPLLAFLNRLQQAYAALGFIHESNLSWKKFRSRPERVHSATVRNTQTGCTRKG